MGVRQIPQCLHSLQLGDILVSYVIIDSGHALSPVQCQAITTTSADTFLIVILFTNFIEAWIKIQNLFTIIEFENINHGIVEMLISPG